LHKNYLDGATEWRAPSMMLVMFRAVMLVVIEIVMTFPILVVIAAVGDDTSRAHEQSHRADQKENPFHGKIFHTVTIGEMGC